MLFYCIIQFDFKSNTDKMDAIFNSNFGVMLWIRKKNIQDFLEAVWVDAFVKNDSCVKDGCDYTYHFNWTTNVLTIEPTNEKGECLIRITHNLVHYQHAFDLMKQDLMSVISTNIFYANIPIITPI